MNLSRNFRLLVAGLTLCLGALSLNAFAVVNPMVAVGSFHTVALKSDGTVVTWGYNSNGQLGDGTRTSRSSPAAVPGLSGVVAVAAGAGHAVALKSDGTVATWGWNDKGQLGDGTMTDRLSPVAVPGLTGVVAVAAANNVHTVALKSDGTVVVWGYNGQGRLGDGTTTSRLGPVPVPGLTGVVAVSANMHHTLALKSDGTVAAWGANNNGELGDGTKTDRYSPVAVTGLTGVVAVSAGYAHNMAIKSDGTLWAWGSNLDGEVGDGTTTSRLNAAPVSGLTGIAAVAAGAYHTVALKSDGTVLAWGVNDKGRLGDGTTTFSTSPVVVIGLTGVETVAASTYSAALKSDGTVVAWGGNEDGELGDGTRTDRWSPVAVPGLNLGAYKVASPAPAASPTSDCLFNWAESAYAQLFAPKGSSSKTQAAYYYRYYPGTNTYLATSGADNHLYYLGPLSAGKLLDAGLVSTWLATAGCGGGQATPVANQALSAPTILTAPASAAVKSLVAITVQAGVDPGGAQVSANCSATQSDHPDLASASLSGLGQGGRSVQHSFTFNAVSTQTINCTTYDASGNASPTVSQAITITLQSPAAFVAAMEASPTAAVGELAALASDPANATWVNEVIAAVASGPVTAQTALMATTDTKLLNTIFGMMGGAGNIAVGAMVMSNAVLSSPVMSAVTGFIVTRISLSFMRPPEITPDDAKSLAFLQSVLIVKESSLPAGNGQSVRLTDGQKEAFAVGIARTIRHGVWIGDYGDKARYANTFFAGTGYEVNADISAISGHGISVRLDGL